jgi:hypothetical protein
MEQVTRFCNLIFSSNAISPTKMEYGLFLAKAAALRTLDLSRQSAPRFSVIRAKSLRSVPTKFPRPEGGPIGATTNGKIVIIVGVSIQMTLAKSKFLPRSFQVPILQ